MTNTGEYSAQEAETLCVTRPVHYHVTHTWRIESFEQYFTSNKCHLTSIHSTTFGDENDPGTKWSLQLFPKGDKEASSSTSGSEMVSFFVNLDKNSDVAELPAKYSVSIVGEDRCSQKVTGDNIFKRGSGWGRSKFAKIEELLKDKSTFLVGDAMTIRCTVDYTKHLTTNQQPKNSSSSSSSSVSTEPEKILNIQPESSEENAAFPWHDITFSIGGSQLKAHRWIVAAGSPMLAQLVRGEDPVVCVEGVDFDAFSRMIRFIYTGECDFANNTYKLMSVAHKFRLLSLLNKCEEYLLSNLDKSNCFMMYSLGDLCCTTELKKEASKVIEGLDMSASFGFASTKLAGDMENVL